MHPLELVRVVHRPVEGVVVVRVAGRSTFVLHVRGHRGDELVVHALVHEDAGRRRAVLAGVEVAGDRDALDGLLDVGVVEHDDRRLAAELEVHALEVVGGRLRDLHAGAHRAR